MLVWKRKTPKPGKINYIRKFSQYKYDLANLDTKKRRHELQENIE